MENTGKVVESGSTKSSEYVTRYLTSKERILNAAFPALLALLMIGGGVAANNDKEFEVVATSAFWFFIFSWWAWTKWRVSQIDELTPKAMREEKAKLQAQREVDKLLSPPTSLSKDLSDLMGGLVSLVLSLIVLALVVSIIVVPFFFAPWWAVIIAWLLLLILLKQ